MILLQSASEQSETFRHSAGKVVFRQVRTIDGWRVVGTEHYNASVETLPPHHFSGG
jgi:hypothetical protein